MKYIKPNRIHEANIQAELYKQLKDNKIDCILEYTIKNYHLRVDVAIIKNDNIICVCEIKSYKTLKDANNKTKQYKKYLNLNIPIVYCTHLSKIDDTINKIKYIYNIFKNKT